MRVGDEVTGQIGRGLCVLVGVAHDDTLSSAAKLASKVWNLRIMGDAGRIERSLAEIGGGVLVVSEFTLYGDASRGRRPSWAAAARPVEAEPLVEEFCRQLRNLGATVATGRFGAYMQLELVNEGPVTVLLEV